MIVTKNTTSPHHQDIFSFKHFINPIRWFRPGNRAMKILMLVSAAVAVIGTSNASGLGRARFSWSPVADTRVSGYKIHWGTGSGVYTHTIDAGNVTETIVTGFAEGVEYFSAITAYSSTGEESAYSEELSFVYDSTERVVLLEAENGTLTAPMVVAQDGNTTWVESPASDTAAATTLDFTAPYASDYYVWCRVLAPSDTQDSFFVMIDDQPEQVYEVYGQSPAPAEAISADWVWSRIQISPGVARAYALQSGSHRIRFRSRENALLDRVVIASNADFIPNDLLPRSGDFVQVLTHPMDSSVSVGASTTLNATFVSTGPLTLQWFHNGEPLAKPSQATLSLTNVKAEDAGEYRISATLGTAMAITSPATLSILPDGTGTLFRVRNMSITSGGEVTFEIAGSVGSNIGVYASTDLLNWTLISTQPNTGGTLTINDPESVQAMKRFYRLADFVGP